ncbi:thiamin pyrophosphokinase [Bifidobacterium actinocoloniiforme DSM 22766]|uniref:Thiamin pyrophosphokinase n=1 Tax=Bifidobacterium actinocoloniiforme DSM 22766 TaxID=1437605 RepID=A0A086Z0Y1_9BIFI|nr:thiamine pyrophosphokinase [Bifidobacterium actinocoloniiforme]KFI40181.1 thiamin pyrophosphokinase [Bifidobacterium actinocoloniiforme DSM 22766]
MAVSFVCRPKKDDTDMQAALKLGWARSFRRFTILGGLGGRIDHSIANVACLCLLAQSGGHGVLVGDGLALTVIRDGRLDFPAWWPSPEDGRMVSVFSASDISREVSETGLKYGLERAELDQGMSCGSGVSNEFLDGHPARIEVGQGSLIVSYPLSAPRPSWHTSLEPAGNLGPLDTSPSARLNRIRPVEPPGDA